MKTHTQTLAEIKAKLAAVNATGMDDFGQKVALFLEEFPEKKKYSLSDIAGMLDGDFEVTKTAFQLFLGISKDEFTQALLKRGVGGAGVKAYKADPEPLLRALEDLRLPAMMTALVQKRVTWQDILLTRLEMGRGRAVKGQNRGRAMEDFTEEVVKDIFGEGGYQTRARFTCLDKRKSEKCDFAIPTLAAARVIIESKAYGATGSKQTDVLGDIEKILTCKRGDAFFLLVTDGITWHARLSDLAKIVGFQNDGKIYRIYTMAMAEELRSDLRQLKKECGL